jgi:hypothetical protein
MDLQSGQADAGPSAVRFRKAPKAVTSTGHPAWESTSTVEVKPGLEKIDAVDICRFD